MIAAAIVKLNNCEWPSEKDAKDFGGLLILPAEAPPGETPSGDGGSGEF
jgi:hypothetical protein